MEDETRWYVLGVACIHTNKNDGSINIFLMVPLSDGTSHYSKLRRPRQLEWCLRRVGRPGERSARLLV